ncbi:glycosyltransferase family 9 protein [Pseudobdellovibrio exovorus]|uniref:ADP-heptose:LPS heptosyltransferase II n=1 Tax=Pseudobdellovibrio exovorus JSS TaxID=1184267 RepID=M4V9M0_9BACT|nr:glycosyltransferase family 9 protein [Pseudobdellovibrio exovorus]AGH95140.1 ADP-heptose:LPS heptosyltransferase II [Pseudobdellovibrio exovorus JSS]
MPSANLVIQTAFLGDLILSVPVLKRIKHLFPQDRLIVVCKKGIGEFLVKNHIVDQIIEIEKSNSATYRQALKALEPYHVNHLFCLHRSVRSQLFSARVKARRKIGFYSFLGFWIFDEMVEHVSENPEVLRQFRILQPIDPETDMNFTRSSFEYLNEVAVDGSMPTVPGFFAFPRVSEVKKSLSEKTRIAIFPGSVWATKQWTKEGFVALVQHFISMGYEVDLMGGPAEKPLCDEIADLSGVTVNVLAGKLSVADSIEALKHYDLIVSNDSASTHMASLNARPVVSIFGPTVLSMGFRPWSSRLRIVENLEMNCRPCGRHGHRQCPLKHHLCMKLIEAPQVFAKAQELLREVSS